MTAHVKLSGVTKTYGGFHAIRDASYALNCGETIALVGHNGAGKTTMIKLMLGLIKPSNGQIEVLGENPASGSFAARRKLGYLPEHVSFNMALTGHETLAFYAKLKSAPRADIARLLVHVGLNDAANRRVGTYSKGMRQRLGLAQALLGSPSVLLLDEPTTGLDPALRQHFYDLLDQMRSDGATILMSSHALTEMETKVDRVIIANRGRILADGSIENLRHMAQLPTRVRVRYQTDASSPTALLINGRDVEWQQIGLSSYEAQTAGEDKLQLISSLTAQNSNLADIDVISPTLDELYAHFLNSKEAAE